MTVKELKRILDDLPGPDDIEVCLDEEYNTIERVRYVSDTRDGGNNQYVIIS